MTKTAPNKALEWTNLALGTALIVAPFVTGFAAGPAAVWNACLIGALIVTRSAVALVKYGDWAEWTNAAAGGWLVIAPFVLGFASNAAALWTHVLIGLTVAVLAGLQLYNGRQAETRRAAN